MFSFILENYYPDIYEVSANVFQFVALDFFAYPLYLILLYLFVRVSTGKNYWYILLHVITMGTLGCLFGYLLMFVVPAKWFFNLTVILLVAYFVWAVAASGIRKYFSLWALAPVYAFCLFVSFFVAFGINRQSSIDYTPYKFNFHGTQLCAVREYHSPFLCETYSVKNWRTRGSGRFETALYAEYSGNIVFYRTEGSQLSISVYTDNFPTHTCEGSFAVYRKETAQIEYVKDVSGFVKRMSELAIPVGKLDWNSIHRELSENKDMKASFTEFVKKTSEKTPDKYIQGDLHGNLIEQEEHLAKQLIEEIAVQKRQVAIQHPN